MVVAWRKDGVSLDGDLRQMPSYAPFRQRYRMALQMYYFLNYVIMQIQSTGSCNQTRQYDRLLII